jgi:DNA repair/transcription protein MET18/MMS19
LQTIQSCVVSYEAKTINLYSVTLWDALKFEILAAQEDDLAVEALKALALIATSFSTGTEGPLNAYLRPIVKECIEHLEDAPTKQSQSAGRILHAVASAAPVVAERVVKGILPTLFELFKSSQSIAKRRGLIEVLNDIVNAYIDTAATGDKLTIESLKSFASEAHESMLRALVNAPTSEVSFRLASMTGLVQMTAVPKLLSEEEIDRTVDAVTDIVINEQIISHGDIRAEAIEALTKLAHTVPQAVRDRAIPTFMVQLPDVPTDETSYTPPLEALAKLSSEMEIFDTVVVRLKNRHSAARQQGAPKPYQRALLLALLYAFTFGSPLQEEGGIRSSYFSDYAQPLLDHVQQSPANTWDSAELEIIGRICNVLLRSQTPHFQSTVYNTSMQWLSAVPKGSEEQNNTVEKVAPLSLYYYAATRSEVVESTAILHILSAQSKAVLQSQDVNGSSGPVLRHITLLVNKFAKPKAMQSILRDSNLDVEALLASSPSQQQIYLSIAVTKGLMIQGKSSALTTTYLQLLLRLLPQMPKSCARHFTHLLAPDEILTKQNHCPISGLYNQKAFNQLIPTIVEAIRSADQTTKPNYLLALSGLLQHLPYSIIHPSLATLVPPLLQTLDLTSSQDQDIKASTLTIFESVLIHDPELVAEHTASLVTRLLNATAVPANEAKVRARALQCLALVPKQLKREGVVPFRRQIVKKLMGVLDDGKRSVRAEAVKCRTAWLALEEAEEDE